MRNQVPAKAIELAQRAANTNTLYPRHMLKIALFDKDWQFLGCFKNIHLAEKHVEGLANTCAHVTGPVYVDLPEPQGTKKIVHTVLESETMIPGKHPIGSLHKTPWGPRKAVRHEMVEITDTDETAQAEKATGVQ